MAFSVRRVRGEHGMSAVTDKEMLDWLAHKGCVELEHEYLGPVSVNDGFEKLGTGVDLRAAIQNAMKKERAKQHVPKGGAV
jgi:hypothetical protein